MLHNLWKQRTIWHVSAQFHLPRGFIQQVLTSSASFAACINHFCQVHNYCTFYLFSWSLRNLCIWCSGCNWVDYSQLTNCCWLICILHTLSNEPLHEQQKSEIRWLVVFEHEANSSWSCNLHLLTEYTGWLVCIWEPQFENFLTSYWIFIFGGLLVLFSVLLSEFSNLFSWYSRLCN